MIGVLGGMGPLATLDFFSKVLAATAVRGDGDHVPLLIQSDPRIPPRPAAILGLGPTPLHALLAGRDRLVSAGATALAMPCNTAHFWVPDLLVGCPVPFISIVERSVAELIPLASPGALIGIIATQATLTAKIFDPLLVQFGFIPLALDSKAMEQLVLPGIERVKAGQPAEGGRLIEQAVQSLLLQGAQAIILACTETPLALDAVQSPLRAKCVDSTAALARGCVAWWQTNSAKAG
jgi:aspartate racemase